MGSDSSASPSACHWRRASPPSARAGRRGGSCRPHRHIGEHPGDSRRKVLRDDKKRGGHSQRQPKGKGKGGSPPSPRGSHRDPLRCLASSSDGGAGGKGSATPTPPPPPHRLGGPPADTPPGSRVSDEGSPGRADPSPSPPRGGRWVLGSGKADPGPPSVLGAMRAAGWVRLARGRSGCGPAEWLFPPTGDYAEEGKLAL